ncbi:MAG: BON domain-containing protein [Cytophagales bacterium]|nr:BON domain-containing protein [Cytophagales bacterium]
MKPDVLLLQDVRDELRWEPALQGAPIGVNVAGGSVTLTGQVSSLAARAMAEKATKRVEGVKAVVLALEVKPPIGSLSDEQISHVIGNTFHWHCDIPDQAIRVQVQKGWVTLDGQVEWPYQKHAAEKAVQYILGVQGIINRIAVKPRTGQQIRASILEALRRNAVLEAHQVNVEVNGSRVILKGWVHSWMERRAIEKLAWAAPGVTSVEDDLVVA